MIDCAVGKGPLHRVIHGQICYPVYRTFAHVISTKGKDAIRSAATTSIQELASSSHGFKFNQTSEKQLCTKRFITASGTLWGQLAISLISGISRAEIPARI
jgi:hypothetical protein